MTALTYADGGDGANGSTVDTDVAAAEGSRRWRSVWRIHFYSGMFAMPFILFMALTGLVILYTQPIEDLTQGDVRLVDIGESRIGYDEQAAAAGARCTCRHS